MIHIIKQTESISYQYLKELGFSDEQILSLISVGKKDLEKELLKLKILIDSNDFVLTDINNSLHALKGLLFQLGNHTLAERLNEIRSTLDVKESVETIKQLLFDEN